MPCFVEQLSRPSVKMTISGLYTLYFLLRGVVSRTYPIASHRAVWPPRLERCTSVLSVSLKLSQSTLDRFKYPKMVRCVSAKSLITVVS